MIGNRISYEEVVIDDLSFRIRYLVSEHFNDAHIAGVRLRKLAREGELDFQDVATAPVTKVDLLHRQLPNSKRPDWKSLERELKRRWSAISVRPIRVYYASTLTIRRLGGEMAGRILQVDAIAHDLGVTATFLHLCTRDPCFRTAWTPEERIPSQYGQAHPDAVLADAGGAKVIVEFCGQYSAARLERLADYSASLNLPLQLYTCAPGETDSVF